MEDDFNTETLNIFEARVKKLEEKVVGKETDYNYKANDDMISILSTLGSKLGNALSTRDRMMMVMKRIDELERYLDPSYGDSCDISDEVKADLILAQEDKLIIQHQNLIKLSSMKKCLDSQSIADTLNTFNSDLIQDWQKYDEISKQENDQSQEVSDLLENCNSIIITLTESLIRMNDIVTKAEEAAKPKRVLD